MSLEKSVRRSGKTRCLLKQNSAKYLDYGTFQHGKEYEAFNIHKHVTSFIKIRHDVPVF